MRRAMTVALVATAVGLASCGGNAAPAATPAPGDPVGPWIAIGAGDIAFDQATVSVPASQPFTIVLQNRDAAPHNIAIYAGETGGERRFDGAVFNGPATRWYAAPGLAPGTYRFVCDVHSNMTGRLVVS